MAQSVCPQPAEPGDYAAHRGSPSNRAKARAHSDVEMNLVSAYYRKAASWAGKSLLWQKGGTTLGILIGIVIGLAIAVVTAMFVTRTTLPFVGQAAKSSERSAPTAATPQTDAVPDAPKPKVPVAAGDVPDPNRTAASRQREAPGQSPLQRTEVATVDATSSQQPSQVSSSTQVAAPATSGAPAGDSGNAPIRAATPPQTRPDHQLRRHRKRSLRPRRRRRSPIGPQAICCRQAHFAVSTMPTR